MRRKSKSQEGRKYKEYNVRKDVDAKRLQAIGAAVLEWNYIEGLLNLIMPLSLQLPYELWVSVTSRINGFDGKIAVIKETFGSDPQIPEPAQLPIRKSLNAAAYYKRYRDGIVHAFLTHPDQIVADSIQRKGITDEVLLSHQALDSLNDHLDLLLLEVDRLALIYHYRAAGLLARDDSERRQYGEAVRLATAQHRQYQDLREKLPPLPEFPEEPQAPLASGGAPEPAM
jgi:hypothetical protein